jgi:hypothetical protein
MQGTLSGAESAPRQAAAGKHTPYASDQHVIAVVVSFVLRFVL